MFTFFKSKVGKLNERYIKLMADAHKLSHSNRRAADEKYAEAEQAMEELQQLKEQ